MYDCFDMACYDDTSALQLNIKVNSENLLPSSHKFNTGSLRVPADPSWPKIPQRRLADDAGDVIEPPCVVTLTGTPRKSRTLVRSAHCQPVAKEATGGTFHHQKLATGGTHAIKRRPGSIDPRFQKVTIVKSQVTPSEMKGREQNTLKEISRSALTLPNQSKIFPEKIEKTIPERDVITQQVKREEVDTGKAKNMEDIAIDTSTCHRDQFKKPNDTKSCGESVDTQKDRENCVHVPMGKGDESNSKIQISSTTEEGIKEFVDDHCAPTVNQFNSAPSQTLEHNGQILFMLEKNVQPLPIGAIKIDHVPIPHHQCTTQYYNVQVPVVTYQNVPIRISSQIHDKSFVSDERTLNARTPNKSTHVQGENQDQQIVLDASKKNECDPKHILSVRIHNESPNPCEEKKCEIYGQNCQPIVAKNVDDHVTLNLPEKLENTARQADPLESNNSEFCSHNMSQRYMSTVSGEGITDTEYGGTDGTGEEKVDFNDCETRQKWNTLSRNANSTKREAVNIKERNESCGIAVDSKMCSGRCGKNCNRAFPLEGECGGILNRQMKSEQHLAHAKSNGVRKPARVSEPQIATKQRKVGANLSKKAKSFFQKKCHTTVPASECTLIWPGYRHVKRKHSQRYLHKIIDHRRDRFHRRLGAKQSMNMKHKSRSKPGSCASVCNKPNSKKVLYAKLYRDSLCRNIDSVSEGNVRKRANPEADIQTSNTEDAIEKPTTIPLKTQQLLNASYWEYYNKLKNRIDVGNVQQRYACQVSLGAPQSKKRKGNEGGTKHFEKQKKLSPPEIRTLEQCSVLSSMINNTLDTTVPRSTDTTQTKQLYLNGNVKTSSDPTARTHSAIINRGHSKVAKNVYNDSITSSCANNDTRYIEGTVDSLVLILKTIVFFGGMMYILIAFVPMMYSYFVYEEYDDYEELGYAELAVEYILSSFQEAFGSIFDVFSKIFFRPFFVLFSVPVGNVTAFLKLAESTDF